MKNNTSKKNDKYSNNQYLNKVLKDGKIKKFVDTITQLEDRELAKINLDNFMNIVHTVVINVKDDEVAKKLISKAIAGGIKLDAQDLQGNTALHYACKENRVAIIEFLLSKLPETDIWKTNKNKQTPLLFAVGGSNYTFRLILTKSRKFIATEDSDGKNICDYIFEKNDLSKLEFIFADFSTAIMSSVERIKAIIQYPDDKILDIFIGYLSVEDKDLSQFVNYLDQLISLSSQYIKIKFFETLPEQNKDYIIDKLYSCSREKVINVALMQKRFDLAISMIKHLLAKDALADQGKFAFIEYVFSYPIPEKLRQNFVNYLLEQNLIDLNDLVPHGSQKINILSKMIISDEVSENNNYWKVEVLAKNLDKEFLIKDSFSPLHLLFQNVSEKNMLLYYRFIEILAHKIQEQEDNINNSFLHTIISYNEFEPYLPRYIDYLKNIIGGNITYQTNDNQETPLQIALKKGAYQNAIKLIESGYELGVNNIDSSGNTALSYLLKQPNKDLKLIISLIQKEADISFRDPDSYPLFALILEINFNEEADKKIILTELLPKLSDKADELLSYLSAERKEDPIKINYLRIARDIRVTLANYYFSKEGKYLIQEAIVKGYNNLAIEILKETKSYNLLFSYQHHAITDFLSTNIIKIIDQEYIYFNNNTILELIAFSKFDIATKKQLIQNALNNKFCNIDQRLVSNQTLLHRLIKDGQTELASMFIKIANLYEKDADFNDAFELIIKSDRESSYIMLRELLARLGDVRKIDFIKAYKILSDQSTNNKSLKIAKLTLLNSIDPKTPKDNMVLHKLISQKLINSDDLERIKAVSHKLNVNLKDNDHYTPLLLVLTNLYIDNNLKQQIVEVLLDNGADQFAKLGQISCLGIVVKQLDKVKDIYNLFKLMVRDIDDTTLLQNFNIIVKHESLLKDFKEYYTKISSKVSFENIKTYIDIVNKRAKEDGKKEISLYLSEIGKEMEEKLLNSFEIVDIVQPIEKNQSNKKSSWASLISNAYNTSIYGAQHKNS